LDAFTLDLRAGMKLKVKSKVDQGLHVLALLPPGSTTPIRTLQASRKVNLKETIPADGIYTLLVKSESASVNSYEMKTRAKTWKHDVSMAVSGEERLPLPVYAGGDVKLVAKAGGGLACSVALEGAEGEIKANRSGTRFKIGPFSAPLEGAVDLVVTPESGTSGTVSLRVKVRSLRNAPTVYR
jgi:hypothetical protein